MLSLMPHIRDLLRSGRPFAVASILSHEGSTPRTAGTRMLVREDNTIEGTIGGGLVEARVMDACTGMLDENRSRVMDVSLDQEAKAGMDMICGGSLSVWIRSFAPPFSKKLIHLFGSLAADRTAAVQSLLLTRITNGVPQDPVQVTPGDDRTFKGLVLPKEILADIADHRYKGPAPVRRVHAFEEIMIEPLPASETLYIFGAGHVGVALAQMAGIADFPFVIIDDRETFANAKRFPHAEKIRVIEDFSLAFDGLDIDENAYIVILTRGHLHDQEVLAGALETKAPYIGMIGSKKKRDRIYENLMEEGVTASVLARVHSPIGLSIEAETPGEIAVSIMAELIRERAGIRQGKKRALSL